MGMFISGKVAITAAGVTDEKDITTETDVIYIRPKMDYGTRQRVIGAATKVTAQKAKSSRRKATQDVTVDVGDYQIALLVHNVLGWAGPSFQGVACVAQNIEKLDSDFPIVAAVIQAISDANVAATSSDADAETDADDPNVLELTASSSTS